MENLRNSEPFDGPGPSYASFSEPEVVADPPPAIGQDERRMHVRAYNFWAGLLGDRQFPAVEDLDPVNDPDLGPHSVLLDFSAGFENPAIPFLGGKLKSECELEGRIESLSDVPSRSLLSRVTDHYLQIIANKAPIGFEAEFVNQRGATIMYRGILLPFSSDNVDIDFIYGVINWKEVAPADITQEITEAMDQVLAKKPVLLQPTVPVWADGPTSEPLELDPEIFGVPENLDDMVLPEDASLADWLTIARDGAEQAVQSEGRSRAALYHAISQAYDFYLMTVDHGAEYAILLEDAGLTVQDRAPMTPIVKLVFGSNYDKTRLTEYASALRYAEHIGLGKGELAGFLDRFEGGLKALVKADRAMRRPVAAPKVSHAASDNRARLRRARPMLLSEIQSGDSEFVVLVARRDETGDLVIVGPVLGDDRLTEQAIAKTQI
jgi:hypothetical protein